MIGAEIEQQLITVYPAAAGVAHLDRDPLAINAVAGVLLALACRRGTNVANSGYHELIAHRRQAANQMGFNDGACAAAHHRQVHHQAKGFPIHQVGGSAVVGP